MLTDYIQHIHSSKKLKKEESLLKLHANSKRDIDMDFEITCIIKFLDKLLKENNIFTFELL